MNIQDPLGIALNDYFHHPDESLTIKVLSPDFDDDEIPVHHFFRSFQQMPELEQKAIELCYGKILDIGAGAGCHSIVLQEKGMDVTAIEISSLAGNIMKKRGINKILVHDIFQQKHDTYDTFLLLMNGIGIAGNPAGSQKLLTHLKEMLNPGGQIILDSSDLIYLFDDHPDTTARNDHYYGVVEFQMKYKSITSPSFEWLYLDEQSLQHVADQCGMHTEIIARDTHYGYLARLFIKQ